MTDPTAAGVQAANRLDSHFSSRGTQPGGLWPFVTAGYPSSAATVELLLALQSAGAAGVEVGFPYSDPIADGPVIQTSFSRVLDRGLKVQQVFDLAKVARDRGFTLPMLAMVSYSIVHRIGGSGFCARASSAGFDGLIVPDLSAEEASELNSVASAATLSLCMLVSPTSPPHRRERIARMSTGFTYYMSVAGVTGERRALPPELPTNVQRLRDITSRPVCVGFGISSPEQVQQLAAVCDGVIVGSALVRRVTEGIDQGLSEAEIVARTAKFASELAGGANAGA